MNQPRSAEWLAQWEYAHRGLHAAGVPENSLAAADAAIARGLGIECDVQMSRDVVPMVFHDWELERLTRASGLVIDLPATQLAAMLLGDTQETIPSLERFLRLVGGRVPLLIELKSKPEHEPVRGLEAVLEAVAPYAGPFALMSFDPRVCGWLRERAPGITRGLVGTDSYRNGFEGMWRNETTLEEVRPDFLAVDCRDLGCSEAARWRAGGQPLLTWTIRTPEQRRAAQGLADAVIAEGYGLA